MPSEKTITLTMDVDQAQLLIAVLTWATKLAVPPVQDAGPMSLAIRDLRPTRTKLLREFMAATAETSSTTNAIADSFFGGKS